MIKAYLDNVFSRQKSINKIRESLFEADLIKQSENIHT